MKTIRIEGNWRQILEFRMNSNQSLKWRTRRHPSRLKLCIQCPRRLSRWSTHVRLAFPFNSMLGQLAHINRKRKNLRIGLFLLGNFIFQPIMWNAWNENIHEMAVSKGRGLSHRRIYAIDDPEYFNGRMNSICTLMITFPGLIYLFADIMSRRAYKIELA